MVETSLKDRGFAEQGSKLLNAKRVRIMQDLNHCSFASKDLNH